MWGELYYRPSDRDLASPLLEPHYHTSFGLSDGVAKEFFIIYEAHFEEAFLLQGYSASVVNVGGAVNVVPTTELFIEHLTGALLDARIGVCGGNLGTLVPGQQGVFGRPLGSLLVPPDWRIGCRFEFTTVPIINAAEFRFDLFGWLMPRGNLGTF